ncbi:MAG: hypothetical protein Q7R48_03745 [bacterium]|nr:hypothetical protein [bacterium]
MEAKITRVSTKGDDIPGEIGWVTLKLIPKTEEEKKMVAAIAENHKRLCQEKSSEGNVVIVGSIASDPKEIELEIFFPKIVAKAAA